MFDKRGWNLYYYSLVSDILKYASQNYIQKYDFWGICKMVDIIYPYVRVDEYDKTELFS